MIENDVENDLEPRRMQRVDRLSHFVPAARREPRVGRAENDRVIAPCVGQTQSREMPFVDKRVGGHDLDAGDAEIRQMGDRLGMGEAGESPAQGFRDLRIEARERAQVHFIENRPRPRNALAARLGRLHRDDDRFGRERAAVGAALEHRAMQFVRTIDQRGMGIGEKLGRVEAMSALRRKRAVGAKAIARAGRHPFDGAVENVARPSRQSDAGDLTVAAFIEQAEMNRVGVRRKDRDVYPLGGQRGAERFGRAGAAVHAASAAPPTLACAISR